MLARTIPATVTIALLLGAPLSAQSVTSKVIPPSAERFDSNAGSIYPFALQSVRLQQVIAGSEVCARQVAIAGIKMRLDLRGKLRPGSLLTQMTVRLGHTSVTPATLSKTFASNITSPTTQVFRGYLSLPSQVSIPVGAKSAPFNLTVCAPSSPFMFSVAQGSLLIDISASRASPSVAYFVDAAVRGGSFHDFGVSGTLSSNDPVIMKGITISGPSASMSFTTTTGTSLLPGGVMFGVNDTNINGMPLPVDLSALGAPGNHVYISPISFAPHRFRIGMTGKYFSSAFIAIPSLPSLVGSHVFAQPYVIDSQANAAGVVMGNATRVLIGGTTDLPMALVRSPDIASVTGNILNHSAGLARIIHEPTLQHARIALWASSDVS